MDLLGPAQFCSPFCSFLWSQSYVLYDLFSPIPVHRTYSQVWLELQPLTSFQCSNPTQTLGIFQSLSQWTPLLSSFLSTQILPTWLFLSFASESCHCRLNFSLSPTPISCKEHGALLLQIRSPSLYHLDWLGLLYARCVCNYALQMDGLCWPTGLAY